MTEAYLDDLMKPRIICIADYPNNIFKINEEVELKYDEAIKSWKYSNEGHEFKAHELSRYQHLFKTSDWYEDRAEHEMPEYVRYLDGKAYKVIEHYLEGMIIPCCKTEDGQILRYANCLPTNKDAYIPKL